MGGNDCFASVPVADKKIPIRQKNMDARAKAEKINFSTKDALPG